MKKIYPLLLIALLLNTPLPLQAKPTSPEPSIYELIFEGFRAYTHQNDPQYPDLSTLLKKRASQNEETRHIYQQYQEVLEGKIPYQGFFTHLTPEEKLFKRYLSLSNMPLNLKKRKAIQALALDCQKIGLKTCVATAHYEQGKLLHALNQSQSALAEFHQSQVEAKRLKHIPLQALSISYILKLTPEKGHFHKRTQWKRQLRKLNLKKHPVIQVESQLLLNKMPKEIKPQLVQFLKSEIISEEKYAYLLTRLAQAHNNKELARGYLQEAAYIFDKNKAIVDLLKVKIALFAMDIHHQEAYLEKDLIDALEKARRYHYKEAEASLLMLQAQWAYKNNLPQESLRLFKESMKGLSLANNASRQASQMLSQWTKFEILKPFSQFEPLIFSLLERIKTEDLPKAIKALENFKHPPLAFGVLPYLKSNQVEVREAAKETLIHFKEANALPSLKRLLKTSYPWKSELVSLFGDLLEDRKALELLLPYLKHTHDIDFQLAILKLARWSDTSKMTSQVWPLLKSSHKEIRSEAFYTLQSKSSLTQLQPIFAKVIKSQDTQEEFLRLMGHFAPKNKTYLKHILTAFQNRKSYHLKDILKESQSTFLSSDLLKIAKITPNKREDIFDILFHWYKVKPTVTVKNTLLQLLKIEDKGFHADVIWELRYRSSNTPITPFIQALIKSPFPKIQTQARQLLKKN